MAISPVEILSPQTPNSLTALLQGGSNTLTSAINNAIQAGRDSVNNQTQQNRDLLSERRSEINLRQRRDERVDDQENLDRSFEEQKRQFGITDSRLSAADALRSEKTKLEIEEFKDTKDIRGREVEARLKALDIKGKKLEQEADFLPQTLKTRQLNAENAQTRALNESLALARSGEERDQISKFSDSLKQSLDAYQRSLGELENNTEMSDQQKQAAVAKLRKGLNSDMETIGRMSTGKGISPATTKSLLSMKDVVMESQGLLPSDADRKKNVEVANRFEKLASVLDDKDVFGRSNAAEIQRIHTQSLELFRDNFRKDDLTPAQVKSIRKKRAAVWKEVRDMGKDASDQFLSTRGVRESDTEASVLEDLLK